MLTQATDASTTTDPNLDAANNATTAGVFEFALPGEFGAMRIAAGPGHGFGGGFMPIEVSAEFTAKVTNIAGNDTDIQKLMAEGYNVTAVRPIVKAVVDADGTVTTKATSAILILQNGTSGHAVVSVDVQNARVTEIVIMTRTVIDKTGSS
ncbi:MAG: hypothetical protein ACE14S_01975 [Candidatus Bathyarchaeia archaeon]